MVLIAHRLHIKRYADELICPDRLAVGNFVGVAPCGEGSVAVALNYTVCDYLAADVVLLRVEGDDVTLSEVSGIGLFNVDVIAGMQRRLHTSGDDLQNAPSEAVHSLSPR